MATKKDITKELRGLGVTLKDQHYTHADLTDLLKKAKARAVDPPESEVQTTENIAPQLSAEVLAEMAAVAAGDQVTETVEPVQPETQDPPETEEKTPTETETQDETDDKTPPPVKIKWPDGHTICPRCRVNDTEAYSTKGIIQYRKCRRAICRKTYSVEGKRQKN